MTLAGKVAVVTGSGGGIGRATAVEMARRGANVVVSDVDTAGSAETVALIEQLPEGGEAIAIDCDVRERDQIDALMEGAAEQFGGIDVLHNNAGIQDMDLTKEHLTVDELPEEVWDAVFAINLRGLWQCTKAAAPYLKRSQRGPSIINAGSVAGVTGYPMNPAYNAAKGGILQLTRVTAIDLAPVVRCNCYCPAAVETRMMRHFVEGSDDPRITEGFSATHLVPRIGQPEDVAKLVCFLASDDASWITGATYMIDGGSLAWRGTR